MNPIQLVVKRILSIPHIRKQDIVWYTVHLAPLLGPVVRVRMYEFQMLEATQFRHAVRKQCPDTPFPYIQDDETLRKHLDRARLRIFQSSDGGETWEETT